jgi:hypothetical protein
VKGLQVPPVPAGIPYSRDLYFARHAAVDLLIQIMFIVGRRRNLRG